MLAFTSSIIGLFSATKAENFWNATLSIVRVINVRVYVSVEEVSLTDEWGRFFGL